MVHALGLQVTKVPRGHSKVVCFSAVRCKQSVCVSATGGMALSSITRARPWPPCNFRHFLCELLTQTVPNASASTHPSILHTMSNMKT
jgi:hypothetical protein